MSLLHHYNPSLCHHQDKLLMVTRSHSRGDWRTDLFITCITPILKSSENISLKPAKIGMPDDLSQHSSEDARLFLKNDKLWMHWTVSQYPATQFRCKVVVGELVQKDGQWSVGHYITPNYGRNDFTAMEKNWVCWDDFCWYGIVEGQQVVLQLKADGNVLNTYKTPALPWPWGEIHGGALCKTPHGWFLFFNSRTGRERDKHRYNLGCVQILPEPPFTMLRISRKPILMGEEGCCLDDNKIYKKNVVFCCGAIWEQNQIWMSYGYNDSECRIAKLNMEDLNL